MFWARNDPDAQWIEDLGDRRHFLVHWAVWDTQVNLPVVYLLDLEDSGKRPILNDAYRWPQAQAALMAQSVGGLKLLTIATGFDKDFADLHPKRLRRISSAVSGKMALWWRITQSARRSICVALSVGSA